MGLQLCHFLMVSWESQLGSVGLSFVLNRLGIIVGPTSYVVVGIEMMIVKYLEHRT